MNRIGLMIFGFRKPAGMVYPKDKPEVGRIENFGPLWLMQLFFAPTLIPATLAGVHMLRTRMRA